MSRRFIVTIDGPAGSGKSTLAHLLSERDGFIHIDTGAIYRAIGCILGEKVTIEGLRNLRFDVRISDRLEIYYNGRNIEEFIRTARCGELASRVAKMDFVREFVNNLVRSVATEGRFVIDGRDCGSVIFPDAQLKLYLVADLKERAKRRARDDGTTIDEALAHVKERDLRDTRRSVAPLVKPKDAIEIDTTMLSPDELYQKVKRIMEQSR